MSEVRSFDLRHLIMVSRLQHEGALLDLEQALTRPRAAIWSALLGHWSLAEGPVCTFVLTGWRDSHEVEGFAQARLRPRGDQADVIFLAPVLEGHPLGEEIWSELLKGMSDELALQGVRQVFVRLSDELEAAHLFLDAGFMLYTREDVFRLDRPAKETPAKGLLEPASEDDQWGIAKLCAAATPRLVRSLEGTGGLCDALGPGRPAAWENQYVWNSGEKTGAYVRLVSGPRGHWMQLMVHPEEVAHAADIIADALSRLPSDHGKSVYCSLRAYQAHIRGPLQDFGFRFLTCQSVLVRLNVVPLRVAEKRRAAALEKRAEARTPSAVPNGRLNSTALAPDLLEVGSGDPTRFERVS